MIAKDWRLANLSRADKALCAFAEKLTREPENMKRSDIEELRTYGLDDRAVHDATQVISYFNYINRIADALGVEYENFVRPWELSAWSKGR